MGFFANLFGMSEAKKADIMNELDVISAINAHVQWKMRLEKYLDGTSEEKLDSKVVCLDNQCKLGKWIYGSATEHFQDDESLDNLRDEHAKFHIYAGRIVDFVHAKDMDAAKDLLDGDYKFASRKVVFALSELSKHLQEKSS
jgi:Chemoreceptor zinc-binding domain